MVLTDSPVRQRLAEQSQNKKEKPQRKSQRGARKALFTKKKNMGKENEAVEHQEQNSSDDFEEEEDIPYAEFDSNCDVLPLEAVMPAPTFDNINDGDFILVSHAGKSTKKYRVGTVVSKDSSENTVRAKFLVRKSRKGSLQFVQGVSKKKFTLA